MKSILLVLFLLVGQIASAQTIKKFVPIRKDRELYVDWTKAQPGQQTVILLNGLTYSTRQWDMFAQTLIKKGVGVLRYDMYGMGQTLLRYGMPMSAISYLDQVSDLEDLVKALKIPKPLNLVGLSYGGGIAMAYAGEYPENVSKLILMAPYTEPVEEQDKWIQSQIWYTRRTVPYNPATEDELYDFFLRQIVYTTYPVAEPIVLENPLKLEGVFRMVQGIRKWKAVEAVDSFPLESVHFIVAGSDQYIRRNIMEEFWKKIPFDSKASWIVINQTEHKIPEAIPDFSASWVAEIIKANPLILDNQIFEADPWTRTVKYKGGQFKLGKN